MNERSGNECPLVAALTTGELKSYIFDVEQSKEKIIVKGTVGSWYHKQLVQEKIKRFFGGEVDNRLSVANV
jgi:hypothetical protein